MIPAFRISVWKPDMSSCIVSDVAYTDCMGGSVTCEDTPGGCNSGQIVLGLRYEDVYARGYWTAPNIVEISTADDQLQHPIATSGFTAGEIAAGAVAKIYVTSTLPYDPAQGEDTQQLYIDDGVHLTMGLPVVNVATDATGPYCAVKAPLTMPGNPTTIFAYGVGAFIGRRRYAGVIKLRNRPNQKIPKATITLGPLSDAFYEAYGGYTVGAALNVDVTTAIYAFISRTDFTTSHYPHLTISAANFATPTGSTFSGNRQNASVADMVNDAIKAISSGDLWFVRVGHDRAPRLINLYTSATNTYTFSVSLAQGSTTFEPLNVVFDDQDYSQAYNSILVMGGTNPATQQPYSAIVQDATAISLAGRQLDGAPVTNTSLMSDTACATYASGLLKQFSIGRSKGSFRVHTRNDIAPDQAPQGLANGDVVRGVQCVIVTGFDGGAPNEFGLASSIVSTIDINMGERYQDVAFAAVEPDWTATMEEADNAIASSLHANTGTGASINSYCVSPGALSPTIFSDSLVVGTPAFLALFSQGSAVVAIAANASAFTLPAGTTSWVWLTTGGTWTIQQVPTSVAGAIPYGYFTTSTLPPDLTTESGIDITTESGVRLTSETAGVIGFTPLASIGVMQVGVGNVNFGNHPTPTISTSSLAAGFTDNSVHAQINASATATNCTTDATVTGLAFYYALHGSTDPNKFKPVGEATIAQGNGATQTLQLGFEIGAGQNVDVYVGFVGIGSADYGPLVQIGSPAQIASGFMPASLVVTAPYMASSAVTPVFSAHNLATPQVTSTGLTCRITATCTISNQPTDGTLAKLVWWVRRSGDPTWSFEGRSPVPGVANGTLPTASQAYTYDYTDLTNGVTYEFGVSFESIATTEGAIASLGTQTATIVSLGNTHFTAMPSAIVSAGPTVSAASLGTQRGGSGVAMQDLSITVSDTLGGWFAGAVLVLRKAVTHELVGLPVPLPGSGPTWSATVAIPAGLTVDVGIQYLGNASDTSAIVYPATPPVSLSGAIATNIGVGYFKRAPVAPPSVSGASYVFTDSANGISGSITLTFTIGNQPTDQSLSRIAIYRRKTSSGAMFDKLVDFPAIGLPNPVASQQYIYTANDLTNGVAYDWGVAFEDAQGDEAPAVPTGGTETRFADAAHGFVIATPAATVIIGTVALAKMPGGIASAGPTLSGAPTVGAQRAGSGVAMQDVTFQVAAADYGGSFGTVPNWLQNAVLILRKAGSHEPVGIVNPLTPTTTGAYAGTVQIPAGVSVDVGVYYVDQSGAPSAVTWPSQWFSIVGGGIANTAMGAMPAALVSAGPTVTTGSASTRTIGRGVRQTTTLTVTVSDFSAQPSWAGDVYTVTRINGGATTDAVPVKWGSGVTYNVGAGTATFVRAVNAFAGDNIDLGIYYKDSFGQTSAINWAVSAQADANGDFFDSGDGYVGVNYGRMNGGYRGSWNSGGDLTTTLHLKLNGTLQAAVSTSGFTYTASTGTGTTGNSTVTIYWDGTNGSSVPTVHYPSQAVGTTTAVTANNDPVTGLNASTPYYFCMRINMATNAIDVRQQAASTASVADHQWLNLDGFLPIAVNMQCNTPAVSTGTGGTPPGGGGGGTQCPSVDQLMLTRRGMIRAGNIVAGDDVCGPDDQWKPVIASSSMPGLLMRVRVGEGAKAEVFEIEETHLWRRPDGSWIETRAMTIGTLLQGVDGGLYPVTMLEWGGPGMFQKLRVVGAQMVMGRLIGHNIITY